MRSFKAFVLSMAFWIGGSGVADTGPSLYDLKSQWFDTDGKVSSVSLAKGHFVLVAMVYTGCAHACPMTIAKVQEVERVVKEAGLKEVKIIIASFDVKNDRPAKLKAYQASRKLAPETWKFLSPKADSDARELAVALGISYKDLGNGDFSHSNVISLLDPNGVVVASIDSLTASVDVFKLAVRGGK